MKKFWMKRREDALQLAFGALTALVNAGLFMILLGLTGLSTGTANAIALIASILFACAVSWKRDLAGNAKGLTAAKSLGAIAAGRLSIGAVDEVIVIAGVDWLGDVVGLAGSLSWALGMKAVAMIAAVAAGIILRKLWRQNREVVSYLFFGVLTTAVNVGLFMALTQWTRLSTGTANAIALAASILFAYVTNRRWVFESRLTGLAAVKEFVSFIACRLATGVLDEVIVIAGVDWLGEVVGLAGSSMWALGVKVFANVLVIIANYVFSKLLIFRKKK